MNAGQLLHQIDHFLWEVDTDRRRGMLVPARFYMHPNMLDVFGEDKSVDQLVNVAGLPGVTRYVLAMPDVHQGYGFPVGGVAAIRAEDGVISPGGIGYDINCGVRLLTSSLTMDDVRDRLGTVASKIQREVPSGVGRGGAFKVSQAELDQVLNEGVQWALRKGFATARDVEVIEDNGLFKEADADKISPEAKARGADQLGTIGSGNHFIEIQRVEKVFDKETAAALALHEDGICVMVHTGSRGLGHQTCTDYVRLMNRVMAKYDIILPDRELACVPFNCEEGKRYFAAMGAAANFAWANRQLITYQIRTVFNEIFGQPEAELQVLYDVSHNIAKKEQHDGIECLVHRKGATRAFGPRQRRSA